MNIPNSFKNKIKEIFYDKEIEMFNIADNVDDEGYAFRSLGTSQGTFKGNVSFDKLKEIQEQYGIDYDIDMIITTKDSVEDKILFYGTRYYEIIENKVFDSYNLLLCKKWISKQSV